MPAIVTARLGVGIDDFPSIEYRTVVADLAIAFLSALTIEVHLNDAAVTVAKPTRHELLHGCFGSDSKRGSHAIDRADQAGGPADIKCIEVHLTQQRRELVRNLRAPRLPIPI